MSDAPRISLNQQLSAAVEVLANRRAGYPKQVAAGKIRQSEADYRIAQLAAITDTLRALVRGEMRGKLTVEQTAAVSRWQVRVRDARETLALKARCAADGNDWVGGSELVRCTDIIEVGGVLDALMTADKLPGRD